MVPHDAVCNLDTFALVLGFEIQSVSVTGELFLFDRVVVLSRLHRTQSAVKARRKLYVALGRLINGATPAE